MGWKKISVIFLQSSIYGLENISVISHNILPKPICAWKSHWLNIISASAAFSLFRNTFLSLLVFFNKLTFHNAQSIDTYSQVVLCFSLRFAFILVRGKSRIYFSCVFFLLKTFHFIGKSLERWIRVGWGARYCYCC